MKIRHCVSHFEGNVLRQPLEEGGPVTPFWRSRRSPVYVGRIRIATEERSRLPKQFKSFVFYAFEIYFAGTQHWDCRDLAKAIRGGNEDVR